MNVSPSEIHCNPFNMDTSHISFKEDFVSSSENQVLYETRARSVLLLRVTSVVTVLSGDTTMLPAGADVSEKPSDADAREYW
jgi:hypothetical protein